MLNQRGYLVIGSVHQYPIGYTITSWWHDGDCEHPMKIVATTTAEDYMEQNIIWDDIYGDNKDASLDDYPFYYRCITD